MGNDHHRYADRLELDGRAFIVLGAGQGFGEETVRALREQGADVICADVDEAAARRVAQSYGGTPRTVDATDRSQMRALFEEAGRRLDQGLAGVVDIVGMVHPRNLAEIDDDDWQFQFDTVFRHAHLAIQYGAPLIARNGGGTMVFMGSAAGQSPRSGTMLPYSVAKAALNQLVRGAAKQWASQRVRMNLVAPGITRTPRLVQANGPAFWEEQAREVPNGRVGEVSDVVGAVLFYCSDLSRHVTGTVLPVDGGASLLNETRYVPKPTRT